MGLQGRRQVASRVSRLGVDKLKLGIQAFGLRDLGYGLPDSDQSGGTSFRLQRFRSQAQGLRCLDSVCSGFRVGDLGQVCSPYARGPYVPSHTA